MHFYNKKSYQTFIHVIFANESSVRCFLILFKENNSGVLNLLYVNRERKTFLQLLLMDIKIFAHIIIGFCRFRTSYYRKKITESLKKCSVKKGFE